MESSNSGDSSMDLEEASAYRAKIAGNDLLVFPSGKLKTVSAKRLKNYQCLSPYSTSLMYVGCGTGVFGIAILLFTPFLLFCLWSYWIIPVAILGLLMILVGFLICHLSSFARLSHDLLEDYTIVKKNPQSVPMKCTSVKLIPLIPHTSPIVTLDVVNSIPELRYPEVEI